MSLWLDGLTDKTWAITEEKFEEIVAAIEKISAHGPQPWEEKAASETLPGEDGKPFVNGESLVIPVYGTLMKRANLVTRWSGGTSYSMVQNEIRNGLARSDIQRIVLDMDTPGGTVDGCLELANFIYESRGSKPIVAYSGGMVCSAGQWIASACDHCVIGEATKAGSIGVLMVHFDYSERDKQAGVKRTFIYAGDRKAAGNDAAPLSESDRKYFQETVNYYHDLFVKSIARNRNMDMLKARSIGNGAIYIGEQALAAGLVDEIGTIEVALNYRKEKRQMLKDKVNASLVEPVEVAASVESTSVEDLNSRIGELQAKLDALAESEAKASKRALLAECKALVASAVASGCVLPAVADGGLPEFLCAVSGLSFDIAGESVEAKTWFSKHFMSETVLPLGAEFATRETAKPRESAEDADEKLGLEIAAALG